MIRVVLKGLAGRKVRTALTVMAIVLGVAMVSGAYVFTDRIDKAIDTLFTGAYRGSDAVISGNDIVQSSASGDATVPAELVATVAALPRSQQPRVGSSTSPDSSTSTVHPSRPAAPRSGSASTPARARAGSIP